jgi:hypothetical protein
MAQCARSASVIDLTDAMMLDPDLIGVAHPVFPQSSSSPRDCNVEMATSICR